MIRTFVVALVTIVAVSSGLLEAQGTGARAQGGPTPVSVVGGTPGVTIEFYMDAGKLADATVNTTGGAGWLLDLSNMGKTEVTIYIDVCKDGKIVKVMFVTGSGQAPPEDDGCNRRLAAVSFQSDCGVTQITLDFANFGASVIGCGGLSFRDPKVIGTTAGGAVLIALLSGGGGDSTTSSTFTPTTTTTPPVTTLPPVTTPPVTTTPPAQPAPTAPQAGIPVALAFHPPGANTSLICGVASIQPATPGTTFTITATGPAVLPNQNVSGTFNANGQAAFSLGIGSVGAYTLTMTIRTPSGATATVTVNVNVTSANVPQCPSVPS